MKVINILYNDEIVNHSRLSYVNYYYGDDFSVINNDLPTLIIGWSIVKKNNIENVTILDNEIIKNKLYWCFSFDENKQKHVNDVEYYSRIMVEYYFGGRFTYEIVDPVFNNIHNVNELTEYINHPTKGYFYKNMLYLLNDREIRILNVDTFKFFGFDMNMVFEYLNYYCNKFIKNNDSLYRYYFEHFNGYNNLKRYIVTLI